MERKSVAPQACFFIAVLVFFVGVGFFCFGLVLGFFLGFLLFLVFGCFLVFNGSIFSVSGEKPYEMHLLMHYWPSHVAEPSLESYSWANPMFSGGLAQKLDFVCWYVLFIRIPKMGANQSLWSIPAVSSGSQCCECFLYSEILSSARGCKCKKGFGNTTQSSSQFWSSFSKIELHADWGEET